MDRVCSRIIVGARGERGALLPGLAATLAAALAAATGCHSTAPAATAARSAASADADETSEDPNLRPHPDSAQLVVTASGRELEYTKDDERPVYPPGCNQAQAEELEQHLDVLKARYDRQVTIADPDAELAALRTLRTRPCLAYAAALIELPATTTAAELARQASAFIEDLKALLDMERRDGVVQVYVPLELAPALTASALQSLAPILCDPTQPSCDRSRSYVTRAERALASQYKLLTNRLIERLPKSNFEIFLPEFSMDYVALPVFLCDGQSDDPDEPPEPRELTWETWIGCIDARAPREHRYPTGLRFRDLSRGWLVMRGRRGHHDFADELRVYDLATGAAYAVSSSGSLFGDGSASPVTAITGAVAPEQLRELTFFLLSRPALLKLRPSMRSAVVPSRVPLHLTKKAAWSPPKGWGSGGWSSSEQSQIDFVYIDGPLRAAGSFVWPRDSSGVDAYAVSLVEIMEAGLVTGCAPAQLPQLSDLRGSSGEVSPIDASAAQLGTIHDALEKKLEKLRGQACKGAP